MPTEIVEASRWTARNQRPHCPTCGRILGNNDHECTRPLEDRFWERVDKTDGCWLWTGALNKKGYGAIRHNGRQMGAHQISYQIAFGEVPAGLELDHLCRVPRCVKPDHLEAVTHQVNVHRGIAPTAENAVKTHCKHGHPFDAANTTFLPTGKRRCRKCNRRSYTISNHLRSMVKREDPVTPELRQKVLKRDGYNCVAPRLGATDPCADRWGRPIWIGEERAITLDHVKNQPMMGKRAKSDLAHLVSVCWHHHLDGWATGNRPALREYLKEANAG